MRTLLFLVALVLALPAGAEILQSPQGGFSVDPPQGWTFVEDVTPEHFVMADSTRSIILEIFSQPKGELTDLKAKAADFVKRLDAQGPQQRFAWNDAPAWVAILTRTLTLQAGKVETTGFGLIVDAGDRWISALAYTPTTNYQKAYDQIVSTLNSLAVGDAGRLTPGPLSEVFRLKAQASAPASAAISGLPTPLTLTYDPDLDDGVRVAMERETRLLMAQVGPQVRDQRVIAPGWARFYRQIYRESYEGLGPVADYWKAQVEAGRVTQDQLPQAVLSWLQKLTYDRKKGLTDLSTPWQVLKEGAGDCDSKSLVYLAIMAHLGVEGILMVSAPYDHGMAALDLPGPGARFPFEDRGWLVAELTDTVALGQIQSTKADPSQWIGVALPGHP